MILSVVFFSDGIFFLRPGVSENRPRPGQFGHYLGLFRCFLKVFDRFGDSIWRVESILSFTSGHELIVLSNDPDTR